MRPYRIVTYPVFLIAACLLPVGMAAADASRSNTPLDLRMPDLRSSPMLDEITIPADSQEPEDVSVIGASPAEEGTSNVHVSRTGFGSLYWAVHHPAQAWRVMFPIAAAEEPTIGPLAKPQP